MRRWAAWRFLASGGGAEASGAFRGEGEGVHLPDDGGRTFQTAQPVRRRSYQTTHLMKKLITILCALCVLCGFSARAAEKLNVLLIMADDLRPAMGSYGDAQAKTPHLDRLAARGVRFDRAYVQYPVCNPSRVSMLTGTRPELNGITGNATFFREKMPDIVTLPQLFRQHGATAVSYGKIYHAGLVEGDTENRFLDAEKSWDEAKMFRPTKLGNTGPRRNLTGGKLKWAEVAALEGGDDDQSDGQTAQHAIAAMERLAGKQWFIGAGFHRPHDPFVVSARYVAQFPAGSLTLHRDPPDASTLLKHSLSGGAAEAVFRQFDDRDRMDFLTHYYAGVTQTDAQVGRLMDAMDRLKLWDKTVVIFVGDHGYHLGERGWWNKNTLFERSCRAPFLLVAPGVKPAVCRSLVEFLDIYPTVAELCGLPVPATVQGRSLRPLLADPARKLHDSVLTHITRGGGVTGYGLRTERWRYIEWSDGGAELYDNDRDPGEWHDLSADPAHAETLADLKRQLAARPKVPVR
jgi:iduronate 2-sulfatase